MPHALLCLAPIVVMPRAVQGQCLQSCLMNEPQTSRHGLALLSSSFAFVLTWIVQSSSRKVVLACHDQEVPTHGQCIIADYLAKDVAPPCSLASLPSTSCPRCPLPTRHRPRPWQSDGACAADRLDMRTDRRSVTSWRVFVPTCVADAYELAAGNAVRCMQWTL